MLIPRLKDIQNLKRLIETYSIVFLHGPRGIGKTTLAKQLNPDHFFSLESLGTRDILIESLPKLNGLVVIDDIDSTLDILVQIKDITDKNRNVKFIITGVSYSSILSSNKSLLLGRAASYELEGFRPSEINFEINKHLLKGSLPDSYLSDNDISYEYRVNYLSQLLFQSIPNDFKFSPHIILNFLKTIASANGNLINKSHLANQMAISTSTVSSYLSFFETNSLIRILPHLKDLRKKRVIIRDTGILNSINQIKSQYDLEDSKAIQKVWLSYTIEQVINEYFIKQPTFFVDNYGNEVDLIFNLGNKSYGVIANYYANFKPRESLIKALDELSIDLVFIINNVNQDRPLSDRFILTTFKNLQKKLFDIPAIASPDAIATQKTREKKFKVFISYSHKDSGFVLRLKNKLEKKDIEIHIDIEKLRFGDNIKDFISNTTKNTDFTVQVISINSLRSPYVMIEYLESQYHEIVEGKKKYIPICIDKSLFSDDAYLDLAEDIQEEINKLNEYIKKALERDLPIGPYNNRRERLLDTKANLGKTIDKLKDSLVGDFSDNKHFNANIEKLIDSF